MASQKPKFIAQQLTLFSSDEGEEAEVQLSHELVGLLSNQLYQSPLKAIEELVVNAYDADATECRMHVPSPSSMADGGSFISVFDNGVGMDRQGLIDLWHIGHSKKRTEDVEARLKRKSIGKFGIGKLATYSISRRFTYLSKTKDSGVLGVTLDFSAFDESHEGKAVRVPLPVRRLTKWAEFQRDPLFKRVTDSLDLEASTFKGNNWTLAIVEDLKDRAQQIRLGRLKWVLSTAMPLGGDFHLYLNKSEIKSSKERSKKLVDFTVAELPPKRLQNLLEATGETWTIDEDRLVSKEFPGGMTGQVIVADRSLYGKSDDIMRSHGFFVKVRGRLINQSDPYFGVFPKSYEVWNSFRADVNVDDLDALIMSSREGVEDSPAKKHLEDVLGELFNEARVRYQEAKTKEEEEQKPKREEERQFVGPRLVEEPLADALLQPATGSEEDDEWFYLDVDQRTDTGSLVERLYNQPRSTYSFSYDRLGKNGRLFKYDPVAASFVINDDHEFVQEHSEDARARVLLEDVVTAEVMLEVYLRRSGVRGHVIADVLNSRDILLRSLSRERRFSLSAIASSLRDSASDKHDLEVALIYSARALGFVAKHISYGGEPDGLATFVDYPSGEKRIILEAKSSADVPTLGSIDFAGLHSHMKNENYKADGCLLLAPAYPGQSKEDNEAAARAKNLRISCWTVEQLARVVENTESRHITARAILEVVLTCFAPSDVAARIDQLLIEPTWKHQDLFRAVLQALRDLESAGSDAVRDVSMVLGVLALRPEFKGIKKQDLESAVSQLASASKGALTYRSEAGLIVIHTGWDEIDRRVATLTGLPGAPRKAGPLRG